MNLKATNNVETNKYELEIEVTSEEFNQAINEVYKKESKKMNIPGFRKGKAPRAFIEKYYGEEVFFEAAVDHLYRPMVMEAVEKSELKVISIGEFKIDEIGKEKGILCKLNVVNQNAFGFLRFCGFLSRSCKIGVQCCKSLDFSHFREIICRKDIDY